jgi:hypothetical protein
MILKLLANQVPMFWEAVKFASIQADEVDSKDMPDYLNELLQSLLSEKAQCFIRLDDNRCLIGLLITRIQVNKITGVKVLNLQCLYSWKSQDDSTWANDFVYLRTFAHEAGCAGAIFSSRNSAVWELARKVGFKEQTRTYAIGIV